MGLSVDYFISYRSPYSYLSSGRVRALRDSYDLDVVIRPVLPLAVRQPDFFKSVNPLLLVYIVRDSKRIAEMEGIPYRWPPSPDPVVFDMATKSAPAEQPHIHRITHLGVEAARRGKGLDFYCEVSQVIMSGAVDNWPAGDHLAKAADRAGLDLAELDAAIIEHEASLVAEIADSQAALEAAGHWGVPNLVFEGEPFFGQDRIDVCVWRMQQAGLQKR